MAVEVKTITIERISMWSVGVRLWFVILGTDGIVYSRWSLSMDKTDEILMLSKVGDVISIVTKGAEGSTPDDTRATIVSAEFGPTTA